MENESKEYAYYCICIQNCIPVSQLLSKTPKGEFCGGLRYIQQLNPNYRICTLFCCIGRFVFSLCYTYTTCETTWNVFISYNQFASTAWKKKSISGTMLCFLLLLFPYLSLSTFIFTLILTHPVHQII